MASINTMLVGKYIYIYSQLQVIGQSNFFLEATLNRMKSIVRSTKFSNVSVTRLLTAHKLLPAASANLPKDAHKVL